MRFGEGERHQAMAAPETSHPPSPPLSLSLVSLGLSLCLRLSRSLSPSLCTNIPGAVASTRNRVSWGGGASPGRWEPQCHAPRLPNSTGGGEGGRRHRGCGPRAQAASLPPAFPFRDPKRWRKRGGRVEGGRRHPEREGGGQRQAESNTYRETEGDRRGRVRETWKRGVSQSRLDKVN